MVENGQCQTENRSGGERVVSDKGASHRELGTGLPLVVPKEQAGRSSGSQGRVRSLEILQMFFSVNLPNGLKGSVPAATDHCAVECPEESQIKQTPKALHYMARETGPLLELGSHSSPFLLSARLSSHLL